MSTFPVVVLLYLQTVMGTGDKVIGDLDKARIDNLVQQFLTVGQIPGLSLGIVRNNSELVYAQGYGFVDVDKFIETGNRTLFAIGSITKTFTATIIFQALSETFPTLGESVLDIPILELDPSYNFTLSDRYRSEFVTFRDLLSHRVCTKVETFSTIFLPFTSSSELYYRQRYLPELCGIRTGSNNFTSFLSNQYNNILFSMAGDIIGHMFNSTYEELLGNFLKKLKLEDTTWIKMSDGPNAPNRALPYIWRNGKLLRVNTELLKWVTPLGAAGHILSSSSDMIKFMNFHLNSGKVEGVQVVSEAAMKWMRHANLAILHGSGPTPVFSTVTGYSLAFLLGYYDRYFKIWHGGFLPPYESSMVLYPELGLGIFLSVNGQRFSHIPQEELINNIFELLRGNYPERNWTCGNTTENLEPIRNLSTTCDEHKEPGQFVGMYGDPVKGDLNITLRPMGNTTQPHLYLEWGQFGKGWLCHETNNSFRIEWDSDIWMTLSPMGPDYAHTLVFNGSQLDYGVEGNKVATFTKGFDFSKLPELPWERDSCGAGSKVWI